MESYKLVNSDQNRGKALNLGYKESLGNSDINSGEDHFLFLEDGVFYTRNKRWKYQKAPNTEITQKDFLELPEPIIKGDWVMITRNDGDLITTVKEIESNGIIRANGGGKGYTPSLVKKLSKEQIKILELEE